jgi:hypothetical protein
MRPQLGYDRNSLLRLLRGGYPLEAYCSMCDEFWSISAKERAALVAMAVAAGAVIVTWQLIRSIGRLQMQRSLLLVLVICFLIGVAILTRTGFYTRKLRLVLDPHGPTFRPADHCVIPAA